MKRVFLVVLLSCASPSPARPADDARTSLCFCRGYCAPDGYSWELDTEGPTAGGKCTCRAPNTRTQ